MVQYIYNSSKRDLSFKSYFNDDVNVYDLFLWFCDYAMQWDCTA